MEESKETKQKMPAVCRIFICEAVISLLIILSVLCVKFFFKSEFKKAEKFYIKYFLNDTSVSEVLEK